MELAEHLAAELLLVQLQDGSEAWKFVEGDAPAAALPHSDALRGDPQLLGDIGLEQVQLLPALAQQNMQRHTGVDGFIVVHKGFGNRWAADGRQVGYKKIRCWKSRGARRRQSNNVRIDWVKLAPAGRHHR